MVYEIFLKQIQLLDTEMRICIGIIFGIAIAGWLNRFIPINYGRHLSSILNVHVPNKIAWMLFEGPNLVLPVYYILNGKVNLLQNPMNFILLLPYLVHYINRTIIYPLRNPSKKPLPLEVVTSAFLFTSVNSYFQVRLLLDDVRHLYSLSTLYTLHYWAGLALFATGMFINIQSDNILANLKKKIEASRKTKKDDDLKVGDADSQGYQIPHGGMFEYVSSANYFGEIVEWFGYAISTSTFQAWIFAIFTLSQLSARGLDHHRWYRKNFKNYPKERKAVVPFLY